jgi:hypothetical protein
VTERLEKLDPATPNRGLIEDEIVGAGRVIERSQQKLLRDSRTLALYLISLADAADTGAAAARKQECEDALSNAPKPKPKGPGRPVGPPPGPRPPAGPAQGDDFEM